MNVGHCGESVSKLHIFSPLRRINKVPKVTDCSNVLSCGSTLSLPGSGTDCHNLFLHAPDLRYQYDIGKCTVSHTSYM